MTTPTRILLCGGSSATHVLAADLGRRPDFEVRVLTNRPADWSAQVTCTEHRSPLVGLPYLLPARPRDYTGRIAACFGWDAAAEALAGADVVVLACPVHAHRDLLERLLPALDPTRDTLLGSLYAQGGFDWIVRDIRQHLDVPTDRLTLFGLKRFPYLCKKQDYGATVTLFGRFPGIYAGLRAPDALRRQHAVTTLGRMFDMPVHVLPHFVLCTLTLSNQVLHPATLWSLFGDGGPDRVYRRVPRIYGECDTVAARWMRRLGLEIQAVARRLESVVHAPLASWMPVDPQARWSMRVWQLTRWPALADRFLAAGVRGNRRINRALAPMRPQGDGFVPDLESRFWIDDIPHGLCVVYGLAALLDVPVPAIREMIEGQQRLMGKRYLAADGDWGPELSATNAPQVYGVTAPDLPAFLNGH